MWSLLRISNDTAQLRQEKKSCLKCEPWTGIDCFNQTMTPLIISCPVSIRYAPSDRSGRATVALYRMIGSVFVVGIASSRTNSSWHAGKEEQEFVSILSNLENVTVPGAVQSYKRPIVRVKTFTFHWTPYGRAAFSLRILTQWKHK